MIRLVAGLFAIIVLRCLTYLSMVQLLGTDPSTDQHIFDKLADKDWLQHLQGQGDYPAFPKFSVWVMATIRLAFEPLFGHHWFRSAMLASELGLYAVLYLKVAGFSRSRLDHAFIAGLFTAPLSAVWAQDELLAVIPIVLLFITPGSPVFFSIAVLLSYLLFKSFYIFVPFSRLFDVPKGLGVFPLLAVIALMVIIDNTSEFVPNNKFGSTLWTLFTIDPHEQKTYSLALFALLLVVALVIGAWRKLSWRILYLLIFTAFLNTFYHVNMEYFVFLTLPAIVAVVKQECSPRILALMVLWFLSVVSSNVFYALGYSVATMEVARTMHTVTIIASSLLGLATFVLLPKKFNVV